MIFNLFSLESYRVTFCLSVSEFHFLLALFLEENKIIEIRDPIFFCLKTMHLFAQFYNYTYWLKSCSEMHSSIVKAKMFSAWANCGKVRFKNILQFAWREKQFFCHIIQQLVLIYISHLLAFLTLICTNLILFVCQILNLEKSKNLKAFSLALLIYAMLVNMETLIESLK
jgi:hypothetical protein